MPFINEDVRGLPCVYYGMGYIQSHDRGASDNCFVVCGRKGGGGVKAI